MKCISCGKREGVLETPKYRFSPDTLACEPCFQEHCDLEIKELSQSIVNLSIRKEDARNGKRRKR